MVGSILLTSVWFLSNRKVLVYSPLAVPDGKPNGKPDGKPDGKPEGKASACVGLSALV